MSILAVWCALVTGLLWLEKGNLAWTAALGVLPGALWTHSPVWALLMVILLSGWLSWIYRAKPSAEVSPVQMRQAQARFWREVGVLLTAGTTFMQAVEVAAEVEPLMGGPIREMVQTWAKYPLGAIQWPDWPGEEGEMTRLLLEHGYRHGLTSQQISSHARHLETGIMAEEDAKRQKLPIWLTILPALLLLNVLWLFLVPLFVIGTHSWLKL